MIFESSIQNIYLRTHISNNVILCIQYSQKLSNLLFYNRYACNLQVQAKGLIATQVKIYFVCWY